MDMPAGSGGITRGFQFLRKRELLSFSDYQHFACGHYEKSTAGISIQLV